MCLVINNRNCNIILGLQFWPSTHFPIPYIQRDDESSDGGSVARAPAESARFTGPVHEGCAGIRQRFVPLGPNGAAIATARRERTRGH